MGDNKIKGIELYTSLDTYGKQAEYIRHGMQYDQVLSNVELFLKNIPKIKVTLCAHLISFVFPGFKRFLQDIVKLKKEYNLKDQYDQRVILDISILNFLQFLSPILAPKEYRESFIECVEYFKSNLISKEQSWGFSDYELNKITRLFNHINDEDSIKSFYESEPSVVYFPHQHLYETLERKGIDHRVLFPEYKDFFDILRKSADDLWDSENEGYLTYLRKRGSKRWEGKNTFNIFRDSVLNPISQSFCAAKWLNATIWLETGRTASCHHPPAHKIPIEEVEQDYRSIHNTNYKMIQRKDMLEGKRPVECEYCWKVEDISSEYISDRVYKSIIYKEDKIKKLQDTPWDQPVDLKTVELSFSKSCNFACAYCNKDFSTWRKDINDNGVYEDLKTHDALPYSSFDDHDEAYDDEEDNPYIKAFWKWWDESLQKSLQDIRLTGGEPLLSPSTWKLLDKIKKDAPKLPISINTNLGVKDSLIDKLINTSKIIKNLSLYTSCESTGKQAEFIRDGLNYDKFISNTKKIIENANLESFNIMMTINALGIFTLTEFLDEVIGLKECYGARFPVISLNILRFPAFLNVSTLPTDIKIERATSLEKWLDTNKQNDSLLTHERESIRRLISYLLEVNDPHHKSDNLENRTHDLKTFTKEYAQRRKKNLLECFPNKFLAWLDS